jgi:hypothetical protein
VTFGRWRDSLTDLLCIREAGGVGKTFLVCAAVQSMMRAGGANNTGYYYFTDTRDSMENALACAVMQIAKSSSRYAEEMAARFRDEAASSGLVPPDTQTWNRFLTSIFTH